MKIDREIKSLTKQIAKTFKPQRIILFGSHAYGKPDADSDVDLLVILPFEGRHTAKAIEMRGQLTTELPLDLLVLTPDKLQERLEMNDFFFREIVESGKVLYETNNSRMD